MRSLREPNNDLDPSVLSELNLTGLFSPVDCLTVVGTSTSTLRFSNVKKSENGAVLKLLTSCSGITLSRAKLELVN